MCCSLPADSSIVGRFDVLIGIIQLAGQLLTACTAAHRSLTAWVPSAAAAAAANVTAQAACSVIDLTADDKDDEAGVSIQHAAGTEAAGMQGSKHAPSVQCKLEPMQQRALPEQDMRHGALPAQADTLAQQAGMLLQPEPGLLNQAVLSEPARAGNVSGAEGTSTSRQGWDEGQAPLSLREGVMEDLCMLSAYGMDLAALVDCLLNQGDTLSGTAYAPVIKISSCRCCGPQVLSVLTPAVPSCPCLALPALLSCPQTNLYDALPDMMRQLDAS